MADNMEVIISAIDQASDIFQSIASSCQDMMSSITGSAEEASAGIDEIAPTVENVESAIETIDASNFDDVASASEEAANSADELSNSIEGVEGSSLSDAAGAADELGGALGGASDEAEKLRGSLGVIEGSMLLGAAEQIGNLAGNSESMAQQMNTASIAVGQLATQTGIAEPQMVSLINEISNATFPNDEAMMYVKSLDQIGVSSENLGKSATDLDKINDAFGMGAGKVNSLGQELSVLGVDMNDVSSSFNALAYANANTVGGMDNYYTFLKKYDAQFNELGYDVDQASIIIAAATQKYGGGKAALSGLSDALKEADGDTRKLEEALDMQSGTLDNASQVTGEYEGQLQQLANEEAEHKTILDQVGAAWEDISLSASGALSPIAGVFSAIGSVGSFGMTVKGLKELSTTFKKLKETTYGAAAANYVQAASETVLAAATSAYGLAVGVLTGEIGLAEAATIAWNAVLAMNPLVLVAIAAVGLAVAIYEVGKAFGWWTDVSSMLDAVWAGVNRLWSAFTSHPDVQAVISTLTDVWNMLSGAIGGVIEYIGSFFDLSSGGEFDVVRALIEAISLAWDAMTLPIRTVIQIVQAVIDVFNNVGNSQANLTSIILGVWNLIVGGLSSIFAQIIGNVLQFAANIANYALQAGSQFVNNIINYVKSLPGRFLRYLQNTGKNITTQGTSWVNNAKQKASQLVNGAVNNIKNLPGRAYTHLGNVTTRIQQAGNAWVNNAKTKASSMVSGITNKITGLPGQVYNNMIGIRDKIGSALSAAYNKAKEWVEKIKSKVKEVSGGLLAFGGEDIGGAYGYDAIPTATDHLTGEVFNTVTGETIYDVNETMEAEIHHTLDYTFDFKNVPEGIAKEELMSMLKEAVTDKDVIDKIVSNPDFQKLDSKIKNRILNKSRRARGA